MVVSTTVVAVVVVIVVVAVMVVVDVVVVTVCEIKGPDPLSDSVQRSDELLRELI